MSADNFFCLFDTGDFAAVIVEKYENSPLEPVQGFFLMNGSSGFSLAAKRAAVRVYSVLKNQGLDVRKYSAMFDLSMASTRDLGSISGQSAGLAFALALASDIAGKGHGAVAATGIIEADGAIGRVRQEDLDAKIQAACRALPNGGLILYPQDNRISSAAQESVKEKRIKAIPVGTVAQALHISGICEIDEDNFKKRGSPMNVRFVTGFLAGIILVVWVWYLFPDIRKSIFHDGQPDHGVTLATGLEEKKGTVQEADLQNKSDVTTKSDAGDSMETEIPSFQNTVEKQIDTADTVTGQGDGEPEMEQHIQKQDSVSRTEVAPLSPGVEDEQVDDALNEKEIDERKIDKKETEIASTAWDEEEKFFFWKPFFLESKAKKFAAYITSVSHVTCFVAKTETGNYQVYYLYKDEADKLAKAERIKNTGITF